MADRDPSRGRIALTIVLWLVGFPVLWPLYLARGWYRGRLHAVRASRVVPKERDAILKRIERGEAESALESTLSWTTMASGPEEDVHVEVRFRDGTEVLAQSPELAKLLTARQVPQRAIECHRLGLAAVFAWPLWLASVLLIASYATGEIGWAAIAGIVLLGLAGLALT